MEPLTTAIILVLLGLVVWQNYSFAKERDQLTKKIMARSYNEYVVNEKELKEPTAEELFNGFDNDIAYAEWAEKNPDKVSPLED